MNKEELIGKLQMVYVGDTNALNELIGYYDGLKQGIDELKQENKQLKEQLETGEQQYNHLVEEKEELQEQLSSIAFQLEKQKKILDKANKKIENMFDDGDENKVIDNLIELQKILDIDKGE